MTATTLDTNRDTNNTLSGGALVATSTGAGGVAATRTITGKHYFEATITTLAGTPSVGFVTPAYVTTGVLGATTASLAYKPSGIVVVNGVTLATIAAYVAGNRIGVAIDPTLQQVWFRVNNGNWNNNGANDPATGVGGIDYSSMALNTLVAAVYASVTANVWTMKFSTAFTDVAPVGFASIDTLQITKACAVGFSKMIPPVQAPTLGAAAVAHPHPKDSGKIISPAVAALTYVSGVVKELGVAVAGKKVAAFDSRTNEFLGCTTSAGDGTYSINTLGRTLVYVISFDSPYNLLGLDRVIPG